MPNETMTHNNYIQHRWKPEHSRYARQAQVQGILNTVVTLVALAALMGALVLGLQGPPLQVALFGVGLTAIAVHVLYDFRERARRARRVARALQQEREMFEAQAGLYMPGDEAAFDRFVRRCEAIVRSGEGTNAPLIVEPEPPTPLVESSNPQRRLSPFGSEPSSFGAATRMRLNALRNNMPDNNNDDDDERNTFADDDDDDDERSRSNPFGSRSGKSPFSGRSGKSPFGSSGSSSRSPFGSRSGKSPFGSSSSASSRFSGYQRPIGSNGGMRREGNDDPALAGLDGNNNRMGVRFAAYYPKELAPNVWHPVKAYAMLGYAQNAVATDAEGGDMEKLPDFMFDRNRNTHNRIPEGAQVTVMPHMKGFQFNPAAVSIGFYRTWHRFDFEMRAVDARPDEATNGYLTFMVDGLIVADVPMSVYVGAGLGGDRDVMRRVLRKPYRSVYASLADTDKALAERLLRVYDALGIYTMRDVMRMRAEGNWDEALLDMVSEAEVFQLFWSKAAAKSEAVTQEVARALTRAEAVENFIRPVVWEQPTAPLPEPLQGVKPAYMPDIAE